MAVSTAVKRQYKLYDERLSVEHRAIYEVLFYFIELLQTCSFVRVDMWL
jgi:tRNA A22 N-methylase